MYKGRVTGSRYAGGMIGDMRFGLPAVLKKTAVSSAPFQTPMYLEPSLPKTDLPAPAAVIAAGLGAPFLLGSICRKW